MIPKIIVFFISAIMTSIIMFKNESQNPAPLPLTQNERVHENLSSSVAFLVIFTAIECALKFIFIHN